MLSKGDLRIEGSNFYKENQFFEEPIKHTVTIEDIYDPGRITFIYDYPFEYWNIILRYNNVVDPFEDITPGMTLLIPSKKDLRDIELGK